MHGPIFIFGFPRSGTTLLRAVLGQHSRVQLINEPELIFALRHAGFTLENEVAKDDRPGLLKDIKQIGLSRRHLGRLPEVVVRNFLTAEEPMAFKETYEALLPRPKDANLVWGEKSLNNLFCAKELNALYPKAVLVHIVRDARAAILSYYFKKMAKAEKPIESGPDQMPAAISGKATNFFATQAILWRHWLETARAARAAHPSDRWFEVRFEDLLKTPEAILEPICRASGLDYEPEMIDPESRKADPVLATDASYAHRNIARAIDPSRARSFENLPLEILWVVERYAGEMLSQYRYPLFSPQPKLSSRLLSVAKLAAGFPGRFGEIKSHIRKRSFPLPVKTSTQ